ncbi:MAG TPA: helix-turn-helix transcriptional regulator [Chitinophagaceae bacterium]|nr:helix-turn-helix transcriptional regulator [Chitinophagaceae bacterium]
MQRTIPKLKKIKYIENPVTLGDKIKNRRLALQLTQEQAGRQIGVTRETLWDWENHIAEPTIEFYPAIIEFLGFTPFVFDLSTLGGKVKQYRYLHGLSQDGLSASLGIGGATIMRVEHGIGQVSKATRKALSGIMEV